jgi:hypothetical protein
MKNMWMEIVTLVLVAFFADGTRKKIVAQGGVP